MRKYLFLVTTALLALAGCGTSGSSTPAVPPPVASAPTPIVAGAPISPGNMPAYCRGQVASQYAVGPSTVKTGSPVQQADGSTTIDGTVDKGGTKSFRCRFDAKGGFIDAMAVTSGEAQ